MRFAAILGSLSKQLRQTKKYLCMWPICITYPISTILAAYIVLGTFSFELKSEKTEFYQGCTDLHTPGQKWV